VAKKKKKTQRKTNRSNGGFQLNTEPLPVAERLEDLLILIYGYEKIGKTALAKQFKNPYFIFTEPGHRSLDYPTHGDIVKDWAHLVKVVDAVVEHREFDFIIIDTADLAFDMCQHHVCKNLGIDHPSDEEWGKGWDAVRKEFARCMLKLQRSEKGVMYISHAREVEIKTLAGGKRNKTVPTMSNQAKSVLEPDCDVWACFDYTDTGGRQIILKGNRDIAAGNRCKRYFVGVESVDMGGSEEEAYANFIAAFNTTETKTKAKRSKKTAKRGKKSGHK
jgi:hypothetical protein